MSTPQRPFDDLLRDYATSLKHAGEGNAQRVGALVLTVVRNEYARVRREAPQDKTPGKTVALLLDQAASDAVRARPRDERLFAERQIAAAIYVHAARLLRQGAVPR